jgi:NADH-quinone oxidoreductase subunit N
VVFVVAGIAFKFGAAPFHMWLPDSTDGAPTPITLFIGSAPKLAAFGMTYRLLEVGAAPFEDQWRLLLAGIAVLSLAIGNLSAMVQSNLKRLLAYSTVSHVGFLFVGLAGGGSRRIAGGAVLCDQLRDHVGRGLRCDRGAVAVAASRRTASTTSRA